MDDIDAREVGLYLYRLSRLHREGGHRDTCRRDDTEIFGEVERRLHLDLILLRPDAQSAVQFLRRRIAMFLFDTDIAFRLDKVNPFDGSGTA